MDTFGYLYQQDFIPNSPNLNIIYYNDDFQGNLNFKFTAYLQSNIRYIVVYTTYSQSVTGTYTLTVSGLNSVNLGKIIIPSNTSTTTSTTTTTTTTTSKSITTNHSVIIEFYSYKRKLNLFIFYVTELKRNMVISFVNSNYYML